MKNSTSIHIGNNILERLKEDPTIVSSSEVIIITDDVIAKLWLQTVKQVISNKKIVTICIKSGETNKSIATLETIWKKMIASGADRSSVVVTLGGGVVCDIGGLAAGTFMRGIPVIHIPTTLLAQTDASIGGKTAIDFYGIKNIIGVFWEPSAVIIDVQTLKTLSKRQIVSGMAEIIKHAIIADKPFFNFLSIVRIDEIGSNEWIKIITKSTAIKQKIVEQDAEEKNGIRKQLNFGHTVGHAIEALSLKTKSPLLHGEAVAVGMVAEARLSNLAGHISTQDELLIIATLKRLGLPVKAIGYEIDTVMDLIMKDKKNKEGIILWSLPTSIGSAKGNLVIPHAIIKQGILAVTQ